MPLTMPSTAWSSGASSKTMLAALPPSSSVSRLPEPAIERWMSLPTSVEPVNATFFTSGCETTSEPVLPAPVTMLTTPGGSSACMQISANNIADSGVVSAGLSTTVLPAASAGAIFHASISSGKFHGMTWPATPRGRGLDGAVDIDLVGLHHLGQLPLSGRVDGRETLLAVALHHPSADEQAVMGLDLDVVDRLGRRRILENLPGELGGLLLGDRHQSIVK